MKALFFTLVLFAAAFCAYDYFGAPAGQKLVFKHMNEGVVEEVETSVTASAVVDAPAAADPTVAATPTTPSSSAPASMQSSAPAPTPAPSTATPAPAVPQADPSGFVPPNFQPMEALTKGWSVIPPSAFPRPVLLQKDATFKMSVGSSVVRAGAQVTALAFAQGQLQVAPSATAVARAVVGIDDTDLKQSLLTGYEKWKEARVAILKDAHLRRLARAKSAASAPAAVASSAHVDPAGKPIASASGSYPMLVDHLKSGEVTEIKAENVKHWGDAVATTWEGKPAWAVPVRCEVNTIFGLQPVEAQAIVVAGRVKGWFYSGSGEPVP